MYQQKYLSYTGQSFSPYRREFLYLLAGSGAALGALTTNGGALNDEVGSALGAGTTAAALGQAATSVLGGAASGALNPAKGQTALQGASAGLGKALMPATNTAIAAPPQPNKTNPAPAVNATANNPTD